MKYFSLWFFTNIGLFFLTAITDEIRYKYRGKWSTLAKITEWTYMISTLSMIFVMFLYGAVWLP